MTEGQNMRWPTTLILVSVIGSVTALGWQGTIDGAAVTSIYGSIVGALTVGHYVKTINGHLGSAPRGTQPSETEPPRGDAIL